MAMQKMNSIFAVVKSISSVRGSTIESAPGLTLSVKRFMDAVTNELFGDGIVERNHESEGSQIFDFDDEFIDLTISDQLGNFKYLIHPVRITILRLLFYYTRITRSRLQKTLGINSGVFENHLSQLSKNGVIDIEKEFVDNRSRVAIYINSYGIDEYKKFKKVLEISL